MMRRRGGNTIFIPIVATFAVMFVIVAVVYSTMSNQPVNSYTVDDDEAYQGVTQSGYQFVETEGMNGVKYYIITSNANQTTGTGPTAGSGSPTVFTMTTSSQEKQSSSFTTATQASSVTKTTQTTKSPAKSDEKIAYLTFDDGPSLNTEKILDILDQYDVKATFFVIYHKKMESKYKAIVDRGHTIALHSYSHSYRKIYKSEKAYYADLNKIHDYVQKVTGVDSKIIRFPGGSSNTISNKYHRGIMKDLKKSVTQKGYIFHDWNVDSTDASGINREPDILVEKVKAGVKKKQVIDVLMHDTGKSKVTTVEALPRIIELIQSLDYKIEPITEESEAIQHNW